MQLRVQTDASTLACLAHALNDLWIILCSGGCPVLVSAKPPQTQDFLQSHYRRWIQFVCQLAARFGAWMQTVLPLFYILVYILMLCLSLSLSLSLYLSVCLSVCLFVCVSVSPHPPLSPLSLYMCTCLSLCPSVSFYLSTFPSLCI